MNNTTKRRIYAAPNAELVCLIPDVALATGTQKNWKWGSSTENWGASNSWGTSFQKLNLASAVGHFDWVGADEMEEINNT